MSEGRASEDDPGRSRGAKPAENREKSADYSRAEFGFYVLDVGMRAAIADSVPSSPLRRPRI